jgi:hypothetical protein
LRKKSWFFSLIFTLIIFLDCIAYAADGDWGVNIKNWILRQASALAIAVIVIILVPLIYKRQWSTLIGTIFAAGIGLYFVNNPETLKDIGKILYTIVFK